MQQVPGGSFGQDKPVPGERVIGCYSLDTKGHAFGIQRIPYRVGDPQQIEFGETAAFANTVFVFASKTFYDHPKVELPGLLQLTLGILNAQKFWMHDERHFANCRDRGNPFLDVEFRAEQVVLSEQFLRDTDASVRPLFEQLAFDFDMPPLPT